MKPREFRLKLIDEIIDVIEVLPSAAIDTFQTNLKTLLNGGPMNVREIASKIAKIEGHKSQARIGDIREIIGILADLSYESEEPLKAIIALGIQRAKRKSKGPSI